MHKQRNVQNPFKNGVDSEIHTRLQTGLPWSKRQDRVSEDYCRLLTAISIRERLNMRSRASMLANVSPTAAGSEPSHRRAVMGPCKSLFTMPLLSSSTAFNCFLVKPSPSLLKALSNSPALISSAFPLKAYSN